MMLFKLSFKEMHTSLDMASRLKIRSSWCQQLYLIRENFLSEKMLIRTKFYETNNLKNKCK